MKAKVITLALLLSFVMTTGFSQGKTRGEMRAERNLEKQNQTEALINSKSFVFEARTALPNGMSSVDLTTNRNYVIFQPEFIDSYMPFFGTAYSGIGYGTDTGLKFKGVPEKFTIEKKKKNFYVSAIVKGESDVFTLSLSVGLEGSASLSISSNNRSTITYQGKISAPEGTENK